MAGEQPLTTVQDICAAHPKSHAAHKAAVDTAESSLMLVPDHSSGAVTLHRVAPHNPAGPVQVSKQRGLASRLPPEVYLLPDSPPHSPPAPRGPPCRLPPSCKHSLVQCPERPLP